MRNLSLLSRDIISFSGTNIRSTALDLDRDVIFAASERQNQDSDIDLEVWKAELKEEDEELRNTSPSLLTMFSTATATAPTFDSQIACFRVLPETNRLVIIMHGGDITVLSLDDEEPAAEVEGTVDSGILAASWSPDDSLLALVTGMESEEKLILMTSTFDVLSETPLDTNEFGEDAPINVGWGSKQTQFHGSAGKAAAQAPSSSTQTTNISSSSDDDALPRISWRGDGAFFVVSTLSPLRPNTFRRRTLRVYDRQASLQSTSEPVAGLEHPLAWRPSGNLIASTQRFGFPGGGAGREGRHDVVFLERNGLRHGEFGLREHDISRKRIDEKESGMMWGYKVLEMSWSSDSNVLAVWMRADEGDFVQLWTTGNYHWYLKQEIPAPSPTSTDPGRFTSMSWHPEISLRIILTTATEIIQRMYIWETFASRSKPPNDSGSVAVIDGAKILLTPFRTQNVPPPMCSHQLILPSSKTPAELLKHSLRTSIHASFSSTHDILAVLWESGYAELWDLHTRIAPGRGEVMAPALMWNGEITTFAFSKQIAVTTCDQSTSNGTLAIITVLGSEGSKSDVVTVVELGGDLSRKSYDITVPYRNNRLVSSDDGVILQSPDGQIFEITHRDHQISPIASFPEFCVSSIRATISPDSGDGTTTNLFVGLSDSGRLHVSNTLRCTHILAANANSFVIGSGFVIFTTTAHEAQFAPLAGLSSMLTELVEGDANTVTLDWEKRRVERGSRIVTAVPSTMGLVLQMPRGNLETINPRPLVIAVVEKDLNDGNYRKAFLACRKHRIDLNVIVDHDQVAFMARLSSFVDQLDDVDYINLFLTNLGRGTQHPDAIAQLCDAVRLELERKDLTRYVNSILTAYVVKTPPDHEAGLSLLLRLRESEPQLVEEAVKYIIFLVDANSLFDTALGMYDFSLVLMIAQHAQKDPREYLPFLRELRALSKFYQRFRIDDHLRRHEKALRNLSLAGPNYFDEAMTYVEQHQLYEEALSIWKETDSYQPVLNVYGDWLFERRDFKQAALVFVEAEKSTKVMVCYEKALEWQELFDLALREGISDPDIVSMGYRVAEDLMSKKRYSEGAQVLLDYSKDVRQAVIALVQGNKFSEARRVTSLHVVPDLITEIIYPGALESCAQLVEDIHEMAEQLRKQVQRLRELRVKKVEEPDLFYGTDNTNLHNVDVMTDVSMPATAFTRYTVAPTSVSRTSKRSSRSKRKLERKIGSGRKGTVDEEEYLLKSIAKLVMRYNVTQGEVETLLPHLIHFTKAHRAEGLALQVVLNQFGIELRDAVEQAWKKPLESAGDTGMDSWATRMQEKEKERMINPIERVDKPELNAVDSRVRWPLGA